MAEEGYPPVQQRQQPGLVEHRHAEPLGLLELGARRGARDDVVVFLETEPVTLPPAARIRSVACSRVRSGSVPGEHERLARQRALAGRRALLLEAQAEPAQVVDQRAHLLVGELVVDQLRRRSGRCPGVSAICSGVAASSASIGAEVLREVAAGDVADALDPDREQHARRTAARCEASIAREQAASTLTSPKPSSSSSCSAVEPVEVGRRCARARAAGTARPASRPARRCPSRLRRTWSAAASGAPGSRGSGSG